ncbi:MAG: hypothetical protein ACRDK5_08135, partial [Solirubrobacterales bacterium]
GYSELMQLLTRLTPLIALALALALPAAASAAEQTFTQTVGPITVGGYEVRQDNMLYVPHPNVDGSITRMEVDLVDANGTPIPIQRLMLHHIVFINGEHPDATCGDFTYWDNISNFPSRERFYAAGEERAKLALPSGYGYGMQSGDRWGLIYMLMNHRATADKAYIQYKITVDTDPGLVQVKPYWLDVNNCRADPQYTVPGTGGPGSTHTRSADVVIPEGGRIVAGGGHVHGGARRLTLTEPDCGDRQVADSLPTWGLPEHPFYNVRPVLHEPGPVNMSAFTTPTGIPVAAGERLRLNSLYDNSAPHMRVMGIMVVYIAPDPAVTAACGPLPGDGTTLGAAQPGRPGPIPFAVPLTGLDRNGQAVTIKAPPGKLKGARPRTLIGVNDRFFSRRNLKIRKGKWLRWQFIGGELHNLTLANGPVGIASENLNAGRYFGHRFTRAGTYRFFCSLHPVQMSERVVVKKKKKKWNKGQKPKQRH